MAKKIYIGTSDFAKIIQENGLFADKTLYIKEIIDSPDEVILVTRPRRWGKTLSQSMLQYFLSSEVYRKKTAGLFDNLAIAKVDNGQYIRQHQGKYPVIFISFKDVKESTFDACINSIRILIKNLFREHQCLLQSNIPENQLSEFQQYLNGEKDPQQLSYALKLLCELLYKCHGEEYKVYVLIDEYDTPLNYAYLSGYLDKLTGFMRNLMSSTFKRQSLFTKRDNDRNTTYLQR